MTHRPRFYVTPTWCKPCFASMLFCPGERHYVCPACGRAIVFPEKKEPNKEPGWVDMLREKVRSWWR